MYRMFMYIHKAREREREREDGGGGRRTYFTGMDKRVETKGNRTILLLEEEFLLFQDNAG